MVRQGIDRQRGRKTDWWPGKRLESEEVFIFAGGQAGRQGNTLTGSASGWQGNS